MVQGDSQPRDIDLEKTDRLPVLNLNSVGTDEDVLDDAVPLDMASVAPLFALTAVNEKARAAEKSAGAQVEALTIELATLRGALQREQSRADGLDSSLQQQTAAAAVVRAQLQEALAELERHRYEAQNLRDTLVARDTSIARISSSLSERDAQLVELQQERARMAGLEERAQAGLGLEAELQSAVARAHGAENELRTVQTSLATLAEQANTHERELAAVRRELGSEKLLTANYLQRLRKLDGRSGPEPSVNDGAPLPLQQTDTAVDLNLGPARPLTGSGLTAELIRLDGDGQIRHVLGRRTRVGRAPGCELRIDASSVSRQHALLLVGLRDVIVEDLNSTNGVLVNGRKIIRQLLCDGDQLTIGDIEFRLMVQTGSAAGAPAAPPR